MSRGRSSVAKVTYSVETHEKAIGLLRQFPDVHVAHVDREKNRGADALANMAIDANVPRKKFGG